MADGFAEFPIFLISFVAGAAVVVSLFISKLVRRVSISRVSITDAHEQTKIAESLSNVSKKSSHQSHINKSNKKKHGDKRGRDAKQSFNHQWLLTSLKGHSSSILDMEFSPNGKYLATCGEDKTILIWRTKDWDLTKHKNLKINLGHDHVTLIRWSPDSKAFITKTFLGNVVEVYKLNKKADGWIKNAVKALTYPKVLSESLPKLTVGNCYNECNERFLVGLFPSGHSPGARDIAPLGKFTDFLKDRHKDGGGVLYHEDEIVGLGIASTGKYVVTCSKKTDLVVCDIKGALLARLDTYLMNTSCLCLSSCGRYISACGFTPEAKAWEVQFSKTGEFKQVTRAFDLKGHTSGIHQIAFNSDTSKIGTLSKDSTWKIFNINVELDKGEEPRLLTTGKYSQAEKASCMALSPHGDVIAVASSGTLYLFFTDTAELDATISNVFSGSITSVLFDAEGKFVLVSGNKHVRIFHNVTGYKAMVKAAREKLSKPNNTAAMRERLQQQITDAEALVSTLCC